MRAHVEPRFYVASATNRQGRMIVNDTNGGHLVLDRAYCHRVVVDHKARALAEKHAERLNQDLGW